jgi:hypothetical protein
MPTDVPPPPEVLTDGTSGIDGLSISGISALSLN